MHRDYFVASEKRAAFDEFFCHIPTMTYVDFFHILRIVYYMLNQREIPLNDFLKEMYAPDREATQTSETEKSSSLSQKDDFVLNNSYEIENRLLQIIEQGNVAELKKFIENVPQYHAGAIAGDALRMHKNYFIATYTLATRTAISTGLPSETAYQISDLYIRKLELLTSINTVNQLFANALLDITELVRQNRETLQNHFLTDLDLPVRECILYIQQHINESLTVSSVAAALGYQRTYLSALFSKAMGFHLNDYIYRCKLEESKALLTYTEKSISEISNYLCFSSQSHFHLRFRKAFGMTPAQYRKETKK